MSETSTIKNWRLVFSVKAAVGLLALSGAMAQAPPPVPGTVPVNIAPGMSPALPEPTLPGTAPTAPVVITPADVAPTEVVPVAPAPAVAPGYGAVTSPTSLSVLEVIRESIFGDIWSPEGQAARPWTPLALSTFFTEGWDQPFVLPPPGGGGVSPPADGVGANRIGWINAFGGVFFRAWFFESFYANHVGRTNNNQFIQDFTIFVPFNRRFEIQFDSLFIVSNKGGKSDTYHTNWGDTVIHPRLLLSESKNFGQVLEMGIRIPTGRTENGNGQTSLFPQWSIWWNPIGHWAVRATTGANVPVANNSGYTSYYNLLGIGWSHLGNPDRFFHNSVWYLVAEDSATITGTPRHENVFTLLPGMEVQLGKGLWFGYAGVQVPMTGPQAYTYQAIWAIVHGY